jgi:protein-S-isoprenylcysteine O-methyltransferase Ste14
VLHSFYLAPFAVLWLAWLAYWLLAARNVKATRRRESLASLLLNRVFIWLAAALLAFPNLPVPWLNERFLPVTMAAYWVGFVMLAIGLSFTVWARVYLGRNWSGTVTLKQEHELVRTGPYHLVRHPIYSGLLLAILGTAIAIGEWRSLFAFVSVAVGFSFKMKVEERFMEETFLDEYRRYRAEVPALIPFVLLNRGTQARVH